MERNVSRQSGSPLHQEIAYLRVDDASASPSAVISRADSSSSNTETNRKHSYPSTYSSVRLQDRAVIPSTVQTGKNRVQNKI
jgi:hypothetical protein